MRSWIAAGALALGGLMLVPALTSAQSLGDVANQDKERRKKDKPAKVYTEDDLRNAKGKSANVLGDGASDAAAPATDGSAAAAPADGAKKEKTPDEVRADAQKAWHTNLDNARTALTKAQQNRDELKQVAGDPAQGYGAGRAAVLKRLDEAEAAVATAQDAITKLEEEGRRNGYR